MRREAQRRRDLIKMIYFAIILSTIIVLDFLIVTQH